MNGRWAYDWQADAHMFVKPQYADGALAILAENEPSVEPSITLESHVRELANVQAPYTCMSFTVTRLHLSAAYRKSILHLMWPQHPPHVYHTIHILSSKCSHLLKL